MAPDGLQLVVFITVVPLCLLHSCTILDSQQLTSVRSTNSLQVWNVLVHHHRQHHGIL